MLYYAMPTKTKSLVSVADLVSWDVSAWSLGDGSFLVRGYGMSLSPGSPAKINTSVIGLLSGDETFRLLKDIVGAQSVMPVVVKDKRILECADMSAYEAIIKEVKEGVVFNDCSDKLTSNVYLTDGTTWSLALVKTDSGRNFGLTLGGSALDVKFEDLVELNGVEYAELFKKATNTYTEDPILTVNQADLETWKVMLQSNPRCGRKLPLDSTKSFLKLCYSWNPEIVAYLPKELLQNKSEMEFVRWLNQDRGSAGMEL